MFLSPGSRARSRHPVAQAGRGGYSIGPGLADALLTVNSNVGATVAPPDAMQLHLVGADGASGGVAIDTFAAPVRFDMRRANGTLKNPSALQSTQVLFNFSGFGFGSTLYSSVARYAIKAIATENWTDAAHGAGWQFFTTANGTTTTAQGAYVTPSGGIVSGTSQVDPGAGGIAAAGRMCDYTYSFQTPVTGFSITLGDTTWHTVLVPAGTLATGTIVMPANPIDGMIVNVRTSKAITTLTVSPNTGQSILGAPTTLAIGGIMDGIYRAANTTWYF